MYYWYMPYYQCPRCGGTDSFGQWEQRLRNTNVTYYDNQRHPVGSSNNGFGFSNVRQEYCVSCVSVKMDWKLSADDLNFLSNLFRGIGNLITTMVKLAARIILRTAPYVLLLILIVPLSLGIQDVERPLPTWYIPANLSFSLFLLLLIEIYRKVKIRKQDNKFLRDRFHKILRPVNRRRLYFIVACTQISINLTFLYLHQESWKFPLPNCAGITQLCGLFG
jgi:hypothetical protein